MRVTCMGCGKEYDGQPTKCEDCGGVELRTVGGPAAEAPVAADTAAATVATPAQAAAAPAPSGETARGEAPVGQPRSPMEDVPTIDKAVHVKDAPPDYVPVHAPRREYAPRAAERNVAVGGAGWSAPPSQPIAQAEVQGVAPDEAGYGPTPGSEMAPAAQEPGTQPAPTRRRLSQKEIAIVIAAAAVMGWIIVNAIAAALGIG